MHTQHEMAGSSSSYTAMRAADDRRLGTAGIEAGESGLRPQHSSRGLHAAILILAPAVMAVGLFYHPTIGNPTDPDFFARLGAAVSADTFRWAVAHHLVAVGSGLIALAFLAIDSRLRGTGQTRAAAIGFPLIVGGCLLYALLPAMEFAPLAAAESGADPGAAQRAIFPWFVPTLYAGALLFMAGSVSFAIGILRSRAFDQRVARFVALAMLVTAACRLVPINIIHMDVQAVAGILALWPLAYLTWNNKWRDIP